MPHKTIDPYTDKNLYPVRLRNFVKMYYDMTDYSALMDIYREKNEKRAEYTHMVFAFWIHHIYNFLHTQMVYPDGRTMLVRDLPELEIERAINYLGYEIGLSLGHADTLYNIYKKFKSICKPERENSESVHADKTINGDSVNGDSVNGDSVNGDSVNGDSVNINTTKK